jgi:hypothetical protein
MSRQTAAFCALLNAIIILAFFSQSRLLNRAREISRRFGVNHFPPHRLVNHSDLNAHSDSDTDAHADSNTGSHSNPDTNAYANPHAD